MQYCVEKNCRGCSAVKSGLFPLIKDRRTIDKRLDGKSGIGDEKEYCSVVTISEEKAMVRHIKNKNRCLQPINRKEVTRIIVNTLQIRRHVRAVTHGRVGKKLSRYAENVLAKKSLSKTFWKRFLVDHPDVTFKRPGNVSINRALNCTRKMAVGHLDNLADELIECGIMVAAEQSPPGSWNGNIELSRVFNHDETPQFVNYGVDGSCSRITL